MEPNVTSSTGPKPEWNEFNPQPHILIFRTYFNIIFPSTSGYSDRFLPFRFSTQNCTQFYYYRACLRLKMHTEFLIGKSTVYFNDVDQNRKKKILR